MSKEQRLNWIKKFNACQVQEHANTSVLAEHQMDPTLHLIFLLVVLLVKTSRHCL